MNIKKYFYILISTLLLLVYNRSQFVLLFYSVELDKPGINNGVPDGWLYYTNDMSLYVEYDQ